MPLRRVSERAPRESIRARSLRPRRASGPDGVGRTGRGEDGLTILELVVAISIFALLTGAIASTITSGFTLARNNRNRSIAANLVSQDMDAVNGLPFLTLAAQIGNSTVTTQTVGGVPYTVTRNVQWQTLNATQSVCSIASGSLSNLVVGVTTTVSWADMHGSAPAVATTTVAPPLGYGPNAKNGTFPVTVHSSTGDPQPNVPVTVTNGTNTYQLSTDANGCAFFIVPPSTYSITLSSAGYVDRVGTATPSATYSVSSGGTVPVTFDYDVAGQLVVTPDTSDGAVVPPGVPLTLSYQFFQPPTRVVSGSGWSRTVSGLFPDSYTFWAGDCPDADPATWPGGTRDPNVAVPRLGGAGTGTVSVGTVDIHATSGGADLVGASVTAYHDDGTPSGACPAGSPSSSPGYSLGTTDTAGTLSAALPFGHWIVQVSSGAVSGTQAVAIDPVTDPSVFPVNVAAG